MTKVTNIKNRMYNIPEDISFILNDLDEKDEKISRLRIALEKAADDLEDWGGYVAANNARTALEECK